MQQDQAQATPEQSQKEDPLSLDQQFDKGWEQVELLTEQEATPKREATEPPTKDQGDSTPKPFKVLKVGGKEVPVASEEELIALAQKGADYTKKTQALADERRDAEAKLKGEADRLATEASKMNELLDRLTAAGIVPGKLGAAKTGTEDTAVPAVDKEAEEELAVFKKYDIDPQSAYPHEKKIVKTLANLERELQTIKLREASAVIDAAIEDEREKFPYDDIKDDKGQDQTKVRLSAIVLQKKQAAGVETPDIPMVEKWAREAVRELHDMQRPRGDADQISDDMDPIEFRKKFPKLAASLGPSVDQRINPLIPPPIKPASRPTDLRAKPKASTQGKSLEEFLNEGFNDPDILKALNGGG